MTNWMPLERELLDILRQEGLDLDENFLGDKVVAEYIGHSMQEVLNVTRLAIALTDRGIR